MPAISRMICSIEQAGGEDKQLAGLKFLRHDRILLLQRHGLEELRISGNLVMKTVKRRIPAELRLRLGFSTVYVLRYEVQARSSLPSSVLIYLRQATSERDSSIR